MIIRKEYKFYAAHRNEQIDGKCRNLHGHRYGVVFCFEVERHGSYSTLFSEFDDVVEPHLKEYYDHGMMINRHDPLYPVLLKYSEESGENLKLNVFDAPTSVENLAFKLFSEITGFGLVLDSIELRETDTSVITYTRADWQADLTNAEQLAANPAGTAT